MNWDFRTSFQHEAALMSEGLWGLTDKEWWEALALLSTVDISHQLTNVSDAIWRVDTQLFSVILQFLALFHTHVSTMSWKLKGD
jgi:hypothetical protein